MAGKQWVSGFVWHQEIMVTQYQPRAMNFVLTWHNLIIFILHCLVYSPSALLIAQWVRTSLSQFLSNRGDCYSSLPNRGDCYSSLHSYSSSSLIDKSGVAEIVLQTALSLIQQLSHPL